MRRPPTRRTGRSIAAACGIAVLSGACGSDAAPPVPTHPVGVPYLSRSGTGDATLPTVGLPSTWSLEWWFACRSEGDGEGGGSAGSGSAGAGGGGSAGGGGGSAGGGFRLTVQESGGPSPVVITGEGSGGSGRHTFTTAGRYAFAVVTPCTWQVTATTSGTATAHGADPGTKP
jgi:hypothetical protein